MVSIRPLTSCRTGAVLLCLFYKVKYSNDQQCNRKHNAQDLIVCHMHHLQSPIVGIEGKPPTAKVVPQDINIAYVGVSDSTINST